MSIRKLVYYLLPICVSVIVIQSTSHTRSINFQHIDSTGNYIARKVEDARNFFKKENLRPVLGAKLSESEKCAICKIMAGILQELIAEKRPKEEMEKIITAICIEAKLRDNRICYYWTREYMDMAVGVVEKLVLKPDEICGFYLGPSCATPYDPTGMWNVTLPNTPKPPVKPPQPPAPSAPKMKFLQLTDIHIDLMYVPGSDAECGEHLCCRSNDGKPEPGVPGAGRWGDYRGCDVPLTLVDNLFQHLSTKKEQFDFIIFTGDITAHDDWNQTRSDQISALERLVTYLEKYFSGIPIYFCVGNHDSAPEGSFPPPFITGNNSEIWMYEAMAKNWGRWLPADTKETILKGGFYTMSPYPGFRIISLNDAYCYHGNWWLLINTTDPAGELYWLAQTLQRAEDKREKVFILAHIPTDCMKAWSWNYYRIVSRYESTIVGQFNGHTHTDKFKVYYDVHNLTRPVSVAYVAGAVTPFSNRNPNYRIYTMDGYYKNSSFAVLDYEDYIFDLRKNTGANVSWELEYRALDRRHPIPGHVMPIFPKYNDRKSTLANQKQALYSVTDYGMTSSYPIDWHNLIYRMKDDDDLFNNFYLHINKGGVLTPCTGSCKTKILCDLKSARSDDPELCKDL